MKQVLGGMMLAAAVVLFGVAVYHTAWLSDDAYISYRTVDNLAHGYGMTWNTTERVQAFTNPLWVLANVPAYLAVKAPWQIYISGLATSAMFALLGILVLAFGVAESTSLAVFAVIALSFCRSYVDYSTSGLENPMTHLLLALFVLYAMRLRWTMATIFSMSLCAGLSLVNRMDTGLIFAPVLAYAWLAERNLKATLAILAGLSPFIAWEVFSVVYYGFPFPNTAYAKLGTGIDKADVLYEGVWYLWNSWNTDPLTLVLIVTGLFAVPFALRESKYTALAVGGVLYMLYLVNVGGDFMQGRLLTPVLMLAVLLIVRLPRRGGFTAAVATVAAILISFQAPEVPIHPVIDRAREATNGCAARMGLTWRMASPISPDVMDARRVCDEAEFWYKSTGFKPWLASAIRKNADPANANIDIEFPRHDYATKGRSIAATNSYQANKFQSVGFRGYFSGPKSIITDQYALGDPLLARLPAMYNPAWRIGHFTRYAPGWYLAHRKKLADALEAKSKGASALTWEQALEVAPVKEDASVVAPMPGPVNIDADPNLQAFNDRLELIVRGPLWSPARWKAIVNMNLGLYNALIAEDPYRFTGLQVRKLSALSTPKAKESQWNAAGNVLLDKYEGVEVQLESTMHNALVEISADHNDDYIVLFVNAGHVVGKTNIEGVVGINGLAVFSVVAPNSAIRAGYDTLRIFNAGRDNASIGHVRFP